VVLKFICLDILAQYIDSIKWGLSLKPQQPNSVNRVLTHTWEDMLRYIKCELSLRLFEIIDIEQYVSKMTYKHNA
jgi:hypothetical protein